jgi:hypothetical protein
VPESKILYKIRFDGIYYSKNDSYYNYLKFTSGGVVKSVSNVVEGPNERWVGGGGYSNGYYTIIKDTIFFSTKQAATDPEPLRKAYFIKDTLVAHHYMTKSIRERKPRNNIDKYIFFKNTVNNF